MAKASARQSREMMTRSRSRSPLRTLPERAHRVDTSCRSLTLLVDSTRSRGSVSQSATESSHWSIVALGTVMSTLGLRPSTHSSAAITCSAVAVLPSPMSWPSTVNFCAGEAIILTALRWCSYGMLGSPSWLNSAMRPAGPGLPSFIFLSWMPWISRLV